MAGLKKARRAKEKANASAKAQQYQHRAMTADSAPTRAPNVGYPSVSPFVMTTDTASGSK